MLPLPRLPHFRWVRPCHAPAYGEKKAWTPFPLKGDDRLDGEHEIDDRAGEQQRNERRADPDQVSEQFAGLGIANNCAIGDRDDQVAAEAAGAVRTLAGLAAARARGRTGGRPRLMTRAKLRTAMTMMADRNNIAGEVAEQLGISVSTLYAYVDGEGRAKPRARALLLP